MNDGYEYLIHRKKDKRVIFGGCRWLLKDKGVNLWDDSKYKEEVAEKLAEILQEVLPELKGKRVREGECKEGEWRVEYNWAGTMGFTEDYFPYVGKFGEREYGAVGFCGNGMVSSTISAKVISELPFDEKKVQLIPKRIRAERFLQKKLKN